jgi:hypothetical protein
MKTKKITQRVTVGSSLSFMHSPAPGEAPREFWGSYEKHGTVWIRNVSVEVDLNYVSVSDAIQNLTDASDNLADARLTVEQYNEYGTDRISATVDGMRPATVDEIVWVKKAIEDDAKKAKDREQFEIEEFARRHPGLLKDQ